jgi:flagellar hook-length control protein FliK
LDTNTRKTNEQVRPTIVSALDFLSVPTGPASGILPAPAPSSSSSSPSASAKATSVQHRPGEFDALVTEKSERDTTHRSVAVTRNAPSDARVDTDKSKDRDKDKDADTAANAAQSSSASASASPSAESDTKASPAPPSQAIITNPLLAMALTVQTPASEADTKNGGSVAANAGDAAAAGVTRTGASGDGASPLSTATAAFAVATLGSKASAAGADSIAPQTVKADGAALNAAIGDFATIANQQIAAAAGATASSNAASAGNAADSATNTANAAATAATNVANATNASNTTDADASAIALQLQANAGGIAAGDVNANAGVNATAKTDAATRAKLAGFTLNASGGAVTTKAASAQPGSVDANSDGAGPAILRVSDALASKVASPVPASSPGSTRDVSASGGISDAARRQAWSEMARLLGGTNQATANAGNAANSGANAASSSSGQTGGGQAADARVAGVTISLTPAAQEMSARVQNDSSDQAGNFAAGDPAGAAALAASAFDGARSQTGQGDQQRSDSFATYTPAPLARSGSDAIGSTTTFPLSQAISAFTTQVDATHANGASAALPAALSTGTDADAQQVIRSMRLQWNGSVGEAQLRLQPEHLGQVLVSVRVDQGNVSATLHADSATAQQWIQTHEQELRQALQDQGLRVTQFQVTSNSDDRSQGDQPQRGQQQDDQQPARPRTERTDPNAPKFEVRV